MRPRQLIALVALLLGLLFLARCDQERREQAERARAEDEALLAGSPSAIELATGVGLRLEAGGWRLDPGDHPVDPERIERLLADLASLPQGPSVPLTGAPADFGLPAAPQLRLTLPGGEATLTLGGATPLGRNHYLRLDQSEALVLIPGYRAQALLPTALELRLRRLARFDPSDIERIELPELTLQRSGARWRIDSAALPEPSWAEGAAIRDLLAELARLEALEFLPPGEPAGPLLSLRLCEADCSAPTFGLTVDENDPQGLIGRDPEGVEDVLLPGFLVEPLTRPARLWQATELFDINPFQLAELSVELGPHRIALSRSGAGWETPAGPIPMTTIQPLANALDALQSDDLRPLEEGLGAPTLRIVLRSHEAQPLSLLGWPRPGHWLLQADDEAWLRAVPADRIDWLDGWLQDPEGTEVPL